VGIPAALAESARVPHVEAISVALLAGSA
jgi:hypothetical protein